MSVQHTLLFLCTGNYYRSRYAEMLFNATKPTTFNWHAVSRGFDPSPFNPGPIANVVMERLQANGHPISTGADLPHPKRLAEADLHNAARIIALDAHEHPPYVRHWFPAWGDRIEYWHVADLDRVGAGEALSLIESNVEVLIRELQQEERLSQVAPSHPLPLDFAG